MLLIIQIYFESIRLNIIISNSESIRQIQTARECHGYNLDWKVKKQTNSSLLLRKLHGHVHKILLFLVGKLYNFSFPNFTIFELHLGFNINLPYMIFPYQ